MLSPDVLVTCAACHLGYGLMLSLSSHGLTPLGIDILETDQGTLVGSVSDRTFIAKIFADNPSIKYVLHTATLHKPHVESHSKEQFLETNILGTLVLLEEASKTQRIQGFIFTSTTSTFGDALAPKRGEPAAWIDEKVVPIPKNIYGTSKIAAEDLCQLIHRQTKMPTLVLRTSRFFPEADDVKDRRDAYDDDNLKICELTYRRADIEDIVLAHVCAMRRAKEIGFSKYIISSPPPFKRDEETLRRLDQDAVAVMKELSLQYREVFDRKGWKFLDRLDRVYDSSKAVRELGWQPTYTFERAVNKVDRGEEWKSDLWLRVGRRGYHQESTGVYTQR